MDFSQVPDHWMLVLMGIIAGEPLDAVEGELTLKVGCELVPVSESVLDGLEARAWVEVCERGVVATRSGEYAAKRWVQLRAGKKARNFETYQLKAVKA